MRLQLPLPLQTHLYPTMEDNILDVEREAQKNRPALSWGGKYGNNSVMYGKFNKVHCSQGPSFCIV